jgi:single-stranded-DNA-specific exonuclease
LLSRLHEQPWQLPQPLAPLPVQGQEAEALAALALPEPLVTLLRRRGFEDAAAMSALLDPPQAPDPRRHFPDLGKAVEGL